MTGLFFRCEKRVNSESAVNSMTVKWLHSEKYSLPVLGTIYYLHSAAKCETNSPAILGNCSKSALNRPWRHHHASPHYSTQIHTAPHTITQNHALECEKCVIISSRFFGWDLPTEAPSLRRFKPILHARPLIVKGAA